MAIETIPLFGQFASFQYTIALLNVSYLLDFTFMSRTRSWYLGIFQPNGTPLRTGIRMVEEWPLTLRDQDPRLPPGILLLSRQDDGQGDPGRDDFEGNVLLTYSTGEDAEVEDTSSTLVLLVVPAP